MFNKIWVNTSECSDIKAKAAENTWIVQHYRNTKRFECGYKSEKEMKNTVFLVRNKNNERRQ